MRWYILLAFVSLAVLILTEESEGWWRRRRSSRRRSSYRPPPRYYRRRSISYTRRRRSVSRGCGYLYCYNGGTKYCGGWARRVAKCRCRTWTRGKQCRTITCPRKSCKNGGTNYCKSRGVSACRCRSGFYGSICQYGCPPKSCYNGGKKYCTRGGFLWRKKVAKCRCTRGWKGHDCRIVHCPRKKCRNRGTKYCRNGHAYCKCRPDFSGSVCQNGCPRKSCFNGGKKYCTRGGFLWRKRVAKCRCKHGWSGHDCRIGCPRKTCYNGGTRYCKRGGFLWRKYVAKCICAPGWYGHDCRKGCPSKLCYNGGTRYCRKYVAKCRCAPGWYGHDCRKANKSGCKRFKCLNGGLTECKRAYNQKYIRTPRQCSFCLYTNKNGLSNVKIDVGDASFLRAYDGSKTTVVLIHGWRGKTRSINKWVEKSTKALLGKKEVGNVIVVEWSAYRLSYKRSATFDTPFAGKKLAELIKYICSKTKSKPSNFYLVGYSLGAQVAGFAGKMFKNNKKIGRITGLDPAGPWFRGNKVNINSRLDATDADFVDIIHTNAGTSLQLRLGTKDKCGHLDFWPNGGANQIGCNGDNICNHGRAPELFVDSIKKKSQSVVFRSYRCSSWDKFTRGGCKMKWDANNCDPEMGYNAVKCRNKCKQKCKGDFYLYTNKKASFNVHDYMLISFKTVGSKPLWFGYYPTIRLYGTKDKSERFNAALMRFFRPGGFERVIVPINTDIGRLQSIELSNNSYVWILEKVTVQYANKLKKGSYQACFKGKPLTGKKKLTKGKISC